MPAPESPPAPADRHRAGIHALQALPQESRAGAWCGLLLVFYGCGSGLFAGTLAAQQYVLDGALEAFRLWVQEQRAEGGMGPGIGDLSDELTVLSGRLSAPIYEDATVTGALALVMVICGIGMAFRSRSALRVGRLVVATKVVATVFALHALYSSLRPLLKLTLEKTDALFEMAQSQSGQVVHNPFKGFANIVDPAAIAFAICAVLPLLLALFAVFGRSSRAWCAPATDSAVAKTARSR